MDYMASVRNGDQRLGALIHSYVTTGVTSAILENVVTVTANGFDWNGLRVDADRSIVGVWPVDRYPPGDEPRDFLIIGGADGSVWEHHIFETGFAQDSVSTIKILELAVDTGITVYKRWGTLPLPTNTQPAGVRQAIEDAIYYYGHVVTFPADPITAGTPTTGEWTGTGWIDMDPATGAAGYIISGNNNGGATVEYWPPEYIDLQEGDRSVVEVEIEIVTPDNDSPDADAIFTRDNEENLVFEYQLHVTYTDGESPPNYTTATLPGGGEYYKRTTRNTTKTFFPGNYTFHVWISRTVWWIFNFTIAEAERKVSIVGVLIREDDGTGVGKNPPKFLPVKPPAPEPTPSVDVKALVIPDQAPDGTPLATGYAWSGGPKLSFTTPAQQTTAIEPASEQPSAAVDDQDVDVTVNLVGGKQVNGFATFNFAQGGTDEKHKMTVYAVEIKAGDGTSDPPDYVCVEQTENLRAIVSPAAISGQFEDWTTTSTKVTLVSSSSGTLGKDSVELTAGQDPSDAVEDVEIVPHFKADDAPQVQEHAPHRMTVVKVDVETPEENHVHLKGEEINWHAHTLPTLTEEVTWSFSYTEGTGDPATGEGTEAGDYRDFASTVTSEGDVKLKAEITAGAFSCEGERAIKAAVPDVIDVNFQGTACNLMSHIGNVDVSKDSLSEWKRAFGTTDPNTNNNAAYPAAGVVKCKMKCKASDTLTNNTTVEVKADGNVKNLHPKGAIFSDWTGDVSMDAGQQLGNSIEQYVNNYDYTWSYRVETLAGPGNWGEWVEMNRNPTHHNISVTKGAVGGTLYQWLVMNSCKLAGGLASTSSDKAIVDQIYDKLPDLRSSNDFVITSADWGAANALKYGVGGWSTDNILDNKGGMCGGWFQFFQDLVAVQGVSVERRCYLLQNNAGQNPERKWYSILVDNAGLNQSQPTHPARNFKDVDPGEYPLPRYFGLADPNDDITYVAGVRRYKFNAPNDGHCINFLVSGGSNYLYDACFGPWDPGGVYQNVYPSVPLGAKNGAANNTFRQVYFNSGVPHLYGQIWFRYAADTVLNANLGQNDTTVTVGSTAAADSSGFIRIDDEIIKYTGKTATTFTGCVRGQYGTAKASHTIAWVSYAADTQLNGAIGQNDTTITVDSTANAHSSGTIRIESEVITHTGKTATTFTGCTRGAHGTAKAAHADDRGVNLIESGTPVKLVKTETGQSPPDNFCPVTSEVEEAGLNLNWVQ